MNYRYRYVPYGTSFTALAGARPEDESNPARLYENELAFDVGGVCWGYAGETRRVLDHHFSRKSGQFPAAATAVLHAAEQIAGSASASFETLWLVTHRDPDFDAFCSMFLARQLVSGTIPTTGWEAYGLHPDGWLDLPGGRPRMDWFAPRVAGAPIERQWPLLLASFAAHVDSGRRVKCPRNRTLHSVLYMAIKRGRAYQHPASGATEFFNEVVSRMVGPAVEGVADGIRLNPLFDSVLEESAGFAPELSLLDREAEAYRRDLSRARKTSVFLPQADGPFSSWFERATSEPLLDPSGELQRSQATAGCARRLAADGVFVRDPECILFKEWAREDRENSPLGQGFTFTAIAYSQRRPEAPVNSSEYFLALDPERSDGRHLYPVWAQLQAAEVQAVGAQPERLSGLTFGGSCRPGFEARAGASRLGLFDDPWFDGHNYECTIVVSANRGTLIGPPGHAGDLSDDPVAQIVRRELEGSVFTGPFEVTEFPLQTAGESLQQLSIPIDRLESAPPPEAGTMRLVLGTLQGSVDLLAGSVAEQIGGTLWSFLHPEDAGRTPVERLREHLIADRDAVRIWSRRGLAVATTARSAGQAERLQADFHRLYRLLRDFQNFLDTWQQQESPEEAATECERLTRELTEVKRSLTLTSGEVLQRFLESSGLEEMLESVRDLTTATFGRLQGRRVQSNVQAIARMQQVFELIEYFIVGVYCVEVWHYVSEPWHLGTLGRLLGTLASLAAGVGIADWINRRILGYSPLGHIWQQMHSGTGSGDEPH